LKQRRAGAPMPASVPAEGLGALAAARARLHGQARRALALRYGLPT